MELFFRKYKRLNWNSL